MILSVTSMSCDRNVIEQILIGFFSSHEHQFRNRIENPTLSSALGKSIPIFQGKQPSSVIKQHKVSREIQKIPCYRRIFQKHAPNKTEFVDFWHMPKFCAVGLTQKEPIKCLRPGCVTFCSVNPSIFWDSPWLDCIFAIWMAQKVVCVHLVCVMAACCSDFSASWSPGKCKIKGTVAQNEKRCFDNRVRWGFSVEKSCRKLNHAAETGKTHWKRVQIEREKKCYT